MNQKSTSLTLHNLDFALYAALREHAAASNLSLNRLAKALLAKSLGLSQSKKVADFSQFSNLWSREDLSKFASTQTDFSSVNSLDWS